MQIPSCKIENMCYYRINRNDPVCNGRKISRLTRRISAEGLQKE